MVQGVIRLGENGAIAADLGSGGEVGESHDNKECSWVGLGKGYENGAIDADLGSGGEVGRGKQR